ncbi:E3 ubiquitin/ISG15 ligase TRIM25-like [Nematolebias whitei]|uniref:E3 ubiquitin/ISG15 ligase TRIM25-like n=1 Tax=Nematolebias whitei TaxID=451745 RepID=UPI00189BF406|nr:E3 ubiquitin/ISG15 ligase TRIM25-like [Nematolebias whitei]
MAGIHLQRDVFCCSVCSNLLTNPVTVPCGHCFCMSCINNHLDQKDHVGIYSCPQCRDIFVKRPVLVKNTMIAVVVEQLKKTEAQALVEEQNTRFGVKKPFVQGHVSIDDCYARPEDVACDVCSERKFKAVKSCLQCLVSYCGTHLQPHNDVPPLRKHKLVEATADLQENVCSQHQEVMKMFCRTDQRCICYVCSKDDHHGHNKVSIEAERIERQKELQSARQRIQLRIQERGKDLSVFQQEEDAINEFTDDALANAEKVFTELIYTIEKKLSHIKESLQSRQNSEVGRFTTVRDRVKKEFDDLNRKDAKLDELSRTENHIHFVVNFPSLSHLDDSKYQPTHRFRRQRNFEQVTVAVAEARNKLQEALNEEYEKIQNAITGTNGLPSVAHAEQAAAVFETSHDFMQKNKDPGQTSNHLVRSTSQISLNNLEFEKPSPHTLLARASTKDKLNNFQNRANFLKYAKDITLDPSTANLHLAITNENREAVFVGEELAYPSHPDRFAYSWQVLSRECFTGRCYLEVERSGKGVMVALAYKNISRAGTFNECMFGQNNKSWALDCFKNSGEFRHDSVKTSIPGIWSSRIGVYLDHQAAPADHCYAGPEDVSCDVCSGRKLKAIKSCLVCLASYCEKHLQPHYESAPFQKHKLVEPSKNLQENICSRHDEVMKMFCRTDQKCICYLCSVDEHKGHDTVSAAAERAEKQRKTEANRENVQQQIHQAEQEVKLQEKKVDTINHSADKSVEACEKVLTELIHLVHQRISYVRQFLRSKQETDVNKAKKQQDKLEQKIAGLKRKEAELKQLSDTEDDIVFLKIYKPQFLMPFLVCPHIKMAEFFSWSLHELQEALPEVERTVLEIATNRWMEISVTEIKAGASPEEPSIKNELLRHSQNISLDSDTANEYVSVRGNKAVKKEMKQHSSDKPKRFDSRCQVLSRQSLNERSYWEVKCSGAVSVAVAYENISRTGWDSECGFGFNENSWALECCKFMYLFRHNNALTLISGPRSSRIGVYLDHRAGVLSFYSVSETRTLLHRVQTTFTQPLHAGVGLHKTGDSAELCKLRSVRF